MHVHGGAGEHFQLNPFGGRAPAYAGRPRGGRGFRAGPGRVVSPARRGSIIIMLTPNVSLTSPADVTPIIYIFRILESSHIVIDVAPGW